MSLEYTVPSTQIQLVKMVGGCRSWKHSRKYEVVGHATVDLRDLEFLNQFVWLFRRGHRTNYADRSLWDGTNSSRMPMHTEIWERHNGPIPSGLSVDHIDQNGLNNQIHNFRLATMAQQRVNQDPRSDSKTGYIGVSRNTATLKYSAFVGFQRRSMFVGAYLIPEESALAYNAGARMLYGEFVRINVIPDGTVSEDRKAEIEANAVRLINKKLRSS